MCAGPLPCQHPQCSLMEGAGELPLGTDAAQVDRAKSAWILPARNQPSTRLPACLPAQMGPERKRKLEPEWLLSERGPISSSAMQKTALRNSFQGHTWSTKDKQSGELLELLNKDLLSEMTQKLMSSFSNFNKLIFKSLIMH